MKRAGVGREVGRNWGERVENEGKRVERGRKGAEYSQNTIRIQLEYSSARQNTVRIQLEYNYFCILTVF